MESEAPGPDTDHAETNPAELLAGLLGTTVEELRERPEVVKAKLVTVFGELSQLKEGGGGGPHQLDATRELMRRIRVGLQASGEPVPDELDELPERLAALSGRLGDTTPEELAGFLRGLAGLVAPSPAEGAREEGTGTPEGPQEKDAAQLEEVVAWFEQNIGPLLGLERRRARQEAELQAEYREGAKRVIDAALRRHGITPLTTAPEPTAARPAPTTMNRQRFFWREFSHVEAELRQMLSDGRQSEAQERLAGLLEDFDLAAAFDLALEGEEAVLSFPTPGDLEAARRLQLVIRDSPRLPGWRIVRAPRRAPDQTQ